MVTTARLAAFRHGIKDQYMEARPGGCRKSDADERAFASSVTSSSRPSTAAATSRGDSYGTKRPLSPSTMGCPAPLSRVAMTGRRAAPASAITCGRPSPRDSHTYRPAAISAGTSLRQPGKYNTSSTFFSRASARRPGSRGPLPAHRKRAVWHPLEHGGHGFQTETAASWGAVSVCSPEREATTG